MKEFSVYCHVKEDNTKYYELVIGESNIDKSNYRLIDAIPVTKKELENLSQFLKSYLEKTNDR